MFVSKVRGETFTWEQARDMTFKDIAKNVEVRLPAPPLLPPPATCMDRHRATTTCKEDTCLRQRIETTICKVGCLFEAKN